MTKALVEGKYKELQTQAKDLLFSDNIIKIIMKTAGYSQSYINCHWQSWAERFLKNFDIDKKKTVIKDKTTILSEYLIDKCFEWADTDNPKLMQSAVKVHGDLVRGVSDTAARTPVFIVQSVKDMNVSLNDNNTSTTIKDKDIIDIDTEDIKDV